jgi:hypothetical protein
LSARKRSWPLSAQKIVGREHGDGGEDAEAARAEPNPASGNDESRAADFDGDRERRPQPARAQAKMLLLGDRSGKIEQFCETADHEGRHQRNPNRGPHPWQDQDGRNRTRSIGTG